MRPRILSAFVLTALACHAAELKISVTGVPKTLDPLLVNDTPGETIRYLTGGVLVRINRASNKLEPELAESWQLSKDGASIAFHLRAGLKFSDNSPLTSTDVARTLRRALDPKVASPIGDPFRAGAGEPQIAVNGPRDITVRYKAGKPNLDRLFDTLAITPAVDDGKYASAGPFFVGTYERGQFLILLRNPNYWKRDAAGKQLPYLDSIRVDIQKNQEINLELFLRGQRDVVEKLDPASFERVLKLRPASAQSPGASFDSEFMWFNQSPSGTVPGWKRKWFTSNAFRRAVSGAINRDDIVRIVYHGRAKAGVGPISPANQFWFNKTLKPRAYDPHESLQTLAAAGFTFSKGVLKDRDGHAVEFSLITAAGHTQRERMAALVQADLKKIGIAVNIVTLDQNSIYERIGSSLNYEAVLLGFGNVGEDPINEVNVWMSSGAQHAWWPQEKAPATPWEMRIDELERIESSEASREVRKKAVDELQQIAVTEEPLIYLVNPDYLVAVSPKLKGTQLTVNPPQILWNVEWLRLE